MSPLRLLLATAVLAVLVRASRVAWHHRALSLAIWRTVGWRHVLGGSALFVALATTATVLIGHVPGMGASLGQLVGLSGNAIFAPLESGLAAAGPASAEAGPDWLLVAAVTAFLLPIALLLPWLAYVEEELFRSGLEDVSWTEVAVASLGFGLVHLFMLVPLGAAVAIGGAGLVYATIYRRAVRDPVAEVPEVALQLYRTPRRLRRDPETSRVEPHAGTGGTAVLVAADGVRQRRAAGVFHAAVWHATCNSIVVGAVWLTLVTDALT